MVAPLQFIQTLIINFCFLQDFRPVVSMATAPTRRYLGIYDGHLSHCRESKCCGRHLASNSNLLGYIALANLDNTAMAAAQICPEVQAYRTAITNLRLEDIVAGDSKTTLLCDISTGTPRPIVPFS